jgi:hypothetical protein
MAEDKKTTKKTTTKKPTEKKSLFGKAKTPPAPKKSVALADYPELGSSVVTPDGHTAVVVKHKIRKEGQMVLCQLSDGSTHLHKLSEIKSA